MSVVFILVLECTKCGFSATERISQHMQSEGCRGGKVKLKEKASTQSNKLNGDEAYEARALGLRRLADISPDTCKNKEEKKDPIVEESQAEKEKKEMMQVHFMTTNSVCTSSDLGISIYCSS